MHAFAKLYRNFLIVVSKTIVKVLRKSNGYFVDSSQVAYDGVPFIFTVGDGTAIAGVDEGVRGMASGGVRRLLIPPSLAYVDGLDDGKPGPMPVGFGPR
jgi:FKBP-type peptidyl-prolyl cis-trans isomerase 2